MQKFTGTNFIRAVPKIERSVNGALVLDVINMKFWNDMYFTDLNQCVKFLGLDFYHRVNFTYLVLGSLGGWIYTLLTAKLTPECIKTVQFD
jgi:hypothetical protein